MKLIIGSSDYELSLKDKIESDGTEYIGLANFYNKTIDVTKISNRQTQLQTLFHELTHVFLEEIGETDLSEDEEFVDALSKQIYGFLTRNNLDKIYRFLKVS